MGPYDFYAIARVNGIADAIDILYEHGLPIPEAIRSRTELIQIEPIAVDIVPIFATHVDGPFVFIVDNKLEPNLVCGDRRDLPGVLNRLSLDRLGARQQDDKPSG